MSSRALRIAFDTAGGLRTGIGHVLRSFALAERVRALGARPALMAPVAAGGLLVDGLAISAGKADVIVVDRPDTSAARLARYHRRWPAARLVALDYYGDAVDGLSAVVNVNQARERRVRRPAVYRMGLQFSTLRPSFAAERRRSRRVASRVRRILIGFGGTDPFGWTEAAIAALQPVLPSGVLMDVLSGRSTQLAAGHARLVVHQSVKDPASLLRRCDLAIIGGGTMMIEAACLGLPAIVVPRTPEERVFAGQFARAGAVCVVRPGRSFPARAVRRQVVRLIGQSSMRADMRRAGRRLVDGRGIDRVARLIISAGETT